MITTMAGTVKVYEEVLKEIKNYIHNNHLSPGDKLPSERELAEELTAGRSSVREALRAMELLGLIETRRGEGTFLRSYRPFHTVELLSTFILQESTTKKDLLVSKKIIEKEATKLAFSKFEQEHITQLESILNQEVDAQQRHYLFFMSIFGHAENYLLQKIWQLMEEFSNAIGVNLYDNGFYYRLLQVLKNREYSKIESVFANY
ncbi:FadR/GntR family transcriptional regulator [Aquibacillus salsiterrae]|uniref:GntR family transcriptional regulator n=1 Tax=Aquibacillus salsiterrae TaxID=2950439 RepID=A0A9X3WBM7_9BACI|nr:GntR family transcriptional regulator [Aquibacillus salsiterrae]MDC3415753.1 GntR family transcriptional regulator [Aquibacillus salsiterrae]